MVSRWSMATTANMRLPVATPLGVLTTNVLAARAVRRVRHLGVADRDEAHQARPLRAGGGGEEARGGPDERAADRELADELATADAASAAGVHRSYSYAP
jgi:hypothetical protein